MPRIWQAEVQRALGEYALRVRWVSVGRSGKPAGVWCTRIADAKPEYLGATLRDALRTAKRIVDLARIEVFRDREAVTRVDVERFAIGANAKPALEIRSDEDEQIYRTVHEIARAHKVPYTNMHEDRCMSARMRDERAACSCSPAPLALRFGAEA